MTSVGNKIKGLPVASCVDGTPNHCEHVGVAHFVCCKCGVKVRPRQFVESANGAAAPRMLQ